MPICFKCGKNLATDQSLQYHLQKRVKCNTLSCPTCKKQFPNKLLFDNHKFECGTDTDFEQSIRFSIYDTLKSDSLKIYELSKDLEVKYPKNSGESFNFIKDVKNSKELRYENKMYKIKFSDSRILITQQG